MKRKIISRLLDFADLCDQGIWPTDHASRVFELALGLAINRDNRMISNTRNRLGVEKQND